MVCKITFTTRSKRAKAGFSVLEFFIAASLSLLALAAVASLSLYSVRSFAAIGNYMELDKNSRNALDRLTQIVRESDGLLSYSPHAIELSYRGQSLSFDYSPETKLLTMTDTNNVVKELLTGCDYLNFQVFQRNMVAGTYDQYPVTEDESAAKIVQVSWVCSKHLVGSLLNTESVQSAKIVIRKQ